MPGVNILKLPDIQKVYGAAFIFILVAAFSVINSIANYFGQYIDLAIFDIASATTQYLDGFGMYLRSHGEASLNVSLAVSAAALAIAGAFFVLGVGIAAFAKRRFIPLLLLSLGILLYAIDPVVPIFYGTAASHIIILIAIHLLFLFFLFMGLHASWKLSRNNSPETT